MSTIIEEYLQSVQSNLRLETADEKDIISELATHIEDEVQELKASGLRDEEAANTCLRLLGSAKTLARQIYEAHSQGSWRQALMASLPHVLFGFIFMLNWWRGMGWMLILLLMVLGTTVWGWWHRKSTWLFPWIGYSMLPVIVAGLTLIYLPRAWTWLAILIYLPLALWLLFRIVNHTLKKDWLYLPLMLLPMPVIISWFLATEFHGELDHGTLDRLYVYGPWIGLSFLSLALGVISFIRVRKRWLKVVVLFMTGVIAIALIFFYAWGNLDFVTLLLLMLFLTSIFLIPALLENGVRTGKWGRIFEHRPMS